MPGSRLIIRANGYQPQWRTAGGVRQIESPFPDHRHQRIVSAALEGIGAFGIDEHSLDFKVEFGVVTAGFGEECVALRLGQFECAGEEIPGDGGHDRVVIAR